MLATGHITLSDGLLSASASSETIGHSKVSDRPHHTRQRRHPAGLLSPSTSKKTKQWDKDLHCVQKKVVHFVFEHNFTSTNSILFTIFSDHYWVISLQVCHTVKISLLGEQRHNGWDSLPVTRQCRGCNLNPGPSAPESSTLTTWLPSHPFRYVTRLIKVCCITCTVQRLSHKPLICRTIISKKN